MSNPVINLQYCSKGLLIYLYHTEQLQETHATGLHKVVDSLLTETCLNLCLSRVPSVSLPAAWEAAEHMWSIKHDFDLALPSLATDSGMVS